MRVIACTSAMSEARAVVHATAGVRMTLPGLSIPRALRTPTPFIGGGGPIGVLAQSVPHAIKHGRCSMRSMPVPPPHIGVGGRVKVVCVRSVRCVGSHGLSALSIGDCGWSPPFTIGVHVGSQTDHTHLGIGRSSPRSHGTAPGVRCLGRYNRHASHDLPLL